MRQPHRIPCVEGDPYSFGSFRFHGRVPTGGTGDGGGYFWCWSQSWWKIKKYKAFRREKSLHMICSLPFFISMYSQKNNLQNKKKKIQQSWLRIFSSIFVIQPWPTNIYLYLYIEVSALPLLNAPEHSHSITHRLMFPCKANPNVITLKTWKDKKSIGGHIFFRAQVFR